MTPAAYEKGVKNAKPFLKFKEDLYIYNEDGSYTNEIYEIYNKRKNVEN